MIPLFKLNNRIYYVVKQYNIRYIEESESDEDYNVPEINPTNVICSIIWKLKYSKNHKTNIVVFENDDYYVSCVRNTYRPNLGHKNSDKYLFYSFPKDMSIYSAVSYHIDYTNKNLNLIDNL